MTLSIDDGIFGEDKMARNRPFNEISHGRVKATIWHETFDGETRFNVAFTRLFNDADRWWDGGCFHRDDLLSLGRLAEDVYAWIVQQTSRQSQARDDGGIGGAS